MRTAWLDILSSILEYNATRASRQKKSVASAKTVSACSIHLMWESEQRRVAKL